MYTCVHKREADGELGRNSVLRGEIMDKRHEAPTTWRTLRNHRRRRIEKRYL